MADALESALMAATLNRMQSVVPFDKNVLCLSIGLYTIRPYQHGGFWIENGLGEGMQVTENAIAHALEMFWRENF
jgi:hypothetical protein